MPCEQDRSSLDGDALVDLISLALNSACIAGESEELGQVRNHALVCGDPVAKLFDSIFPILGTSFWSNSSTTLASSWRSVRTTGSG